MVGFPEKAREARPVRGNLRCHPDVACLWIRGGVRCGVLMMEAYPWSGEDAPEWSNGLLTLRPGPA